MSTAPTAAAILHPSTETHVAQFIARPVHAVLLVGPNGIGKTHLAKQILQAILPADSQLAHCPYYRLVSDDKGSISIGTIRELQRFLQLKTLGQEPLRRGIIIEHAEALTTEAQNAFLKLLEEPPADTVIILTTGNQRGLLPTILSRVQAIPMTAPDEVKLVEHFTAQGKEATAIKQAYFMSGGLPGLMTALLADDQSHPLLQGVQAAKEVLQKPTFERLALVEGFSKQKDQARYMLDALQHIAQTGLNQAAGKADAARVKQWHHILKVTTSALQALEQNANTKLVLSNLMLQL